MMRLVLLIFISLLFSQIDLYAQTNDDISKKYQLLKIPEGIMKNYFLIPHNQEMKASGMMSNPGTSNHSYFKELLCEQCNTDIIEEVYVELWKADLDIHLDAGIMIFNFEDSTSLNEFIPSLSITSEERFLRKNNQLMLLWAAEQEGVKQDILKELEAYYVQLNFEPLNVPYKNIDITEEELLSLKSEINDPSNVVKASDRKIKHLFTSEDAFIVFYDDGTLSICPACRLTRENIELMEQEEAFSIYFESKDGVVIQSKDQDMNGSIVIEFSNPDLGLWVIQNFEERVKIPQ